MTTTTTATIEKSLFVEGRLWFDKVNGNTYFSNRVWVDGKIAFTTGLNYGYEEAYLHDAIRELQTRGYLPNDRALNTWEIRDEMKLDLYRSATYGKKSELFKASN